MGTWDAAIMNDDFAQDLAMEYQDLRAEGKPAKRAGEALVRRYVRSGELDDYERVVLHVVVAKLMHEDGATQHPIIATALNYLEHELGVERWGERSGRLLAERRTEYSKLAKELQSRPPKRRRVVLPRVGDILRMPLPCGGFAYMQYVHFDEKTGPYVQVFDLVSPDPLEEIEPGRLPNMFNPLQVGVNPPVRMGRWQVIANRPVIKFEYPTYLYGMPDKDNKVHMWYLLRRDKYSPLGSEIPPKYAHLERSGVINAEVLEKKICDKLQMRRESGLS